MRYFLQRDGRIFGPYSLDDLKRYQSEGRIGPTDEIRSEDSQRWIPQVDFFTPPAPTPPAPTPPAPIFPPVTPAQPPVTPQRQPSEIQGFPPPDVTAPGQNNPFGAPQPPQSAWTPPAAPQQPPNPFAAPGSAGNFGGGFGVPRQPGFGGSSQPQQPFGSPQPSPGAGFGPPSGTSPFQAGYEGIPSYQWPSPPDLHWSLVLLFGLLCTVFQVYWIYRELAFVKKIDPRSKAWALILSGVGLLIGGIVFSLTVESIAGDSVIASLMSLVSVLGFTALFYVGIFDMRTSLERHYNTAENIGLRLNPILTFFFSIYYFQYHFNRINNWKKTGRLQ